MFVPTQEKFVWKIKLYYKDAWITYEISLKELSEFFIKKELQDIKYYLTSETAYGQKATIARYLTQWIMWQRT